jgi:hypothetical protein
MANMEFEACYKALELPFGAGLKEVNERWRKLSRIHHPDRHARNPKNYQIALERQKQLNNARDILKKWLETNPHVAPPCSTSGSQQTYTQNKSANANASNDTKADKSQSSNTNSQTKQGTQNKQQSHANQNHRQSSSQTKSSTSRQAASAKPPNTGWFAASELKLTPIQELVHKIDKHCSRSEPSFLAMILGFAALFGPLFLISATLGSIFPELPGHYPDWLMMTMLGASGWCTCYIFRWFFAEAELIKLQQKEMYFRSGRSLGDTVDLAKSIIEKHTVPNGSWKFAATGAAHEATLHFEEEVFPEVKRSRCLKIRFEARPGAYTVVFAMQVNATSPINSFSCKQLAEKVVTDLKKELQEIAA